MTNVASKYGHSNASTIDEAMVWGSSLHGEVFINMVTEHESLNQETDGTVKHSTVTDVGIGSACVATPLIEGD